MTYELKKYTHSIDLLPAVFIWWANDKGIAMSWLFWSLEIRKK